MRPFRFFSMFLAGSLLALVLFAPGCQKEALPDPSLSPQQMMPELEPEAVGILEEHLGKETAAEWINSLSSMSEQESAELRSVPIFPMVAMLECKLVREYRQDYLLVQEYVCTGWDYQNYVPLKVTRKKLTDPYHGWTMVSGDITYRYGMINYEVPPYGYYMQLHGQSGWFAGGQGHALWYEWPMGVPNGSYALLYGNIEVPGAIAVR